jgi:hypothetical protein
MLETSLYSRKRRRFTPLILIGVTVTVLVALLGVGISVVLPRLQSDAAGAANANCTLIIPADPLSARGLATPYRLVATNPADGPCHEANVDQAAFVQAAIIDPATGKISIYEPLVIDKGTTPAVQPVVPQLPARAVVGIWFGDNGDVLTLLRKHARGMRGIRGHMGVRGGLNGSCVNGLPGSPFGQFAYCNAPAFFAAARAAIRQGKLTIPPIGTGSDGQPCPTVRSFRVVDMDQSDNVQTRYLVTATGQTAQFSAANQAKLPGATPIGNPSDNALVTKIIDPVLGCTPWTAPDLVDNNTQVSALPLDELQAGAYQKAPIARIPLGDPMTVVNGHISRTKTNLYRLGVNQRLVPFDDGNTTTYCKNLITIGLAGLQLDKTLFQGAPSPDTGAANSLYTFLANRLSETFSADGLNCVGLLKIQNPITLTTDTSGVVTDATFDTSPTAANAGTATTTVGTATTATVTGTTTATTTITATVTSTVTATDTTTGATGTITTTDTAGTPVAVPATNTGN